jgi:hypothetical protein
MAMTYPASTKQIDFINDLLAKRQVPENIVSTIKSAQVLTSQAASGFISLLLTYPKIVAAQSSQDGGLAAYIAAFENVPNGRYAIPNSDIVSAFPRLSLTGDLLFLEVKSYMGKRYMRRLTGGGDGGSYIRSKLPYAETLGLLKYIALRPVELMQAYGRANACCGRCGKGLTDPTSRAMFLGPECRKELGL